VGRFQHLATRLSIVGALALVIGTSLVAGVITQALTSSAFADTAPYETFCANTPAGNIVLNDVVVSGALSPSSPTTGQQFNVTGLEVKEQLPAAVVQDAAATGLTSLTGTLTTSVDATGATPPSISTGAMSFDIPIPNPVPASGITLQVPSTPATVGPFTATSSNITVSEAAVANTTDIDGDGIGLIALDCSSYPNDTLPSGFTSNSPPGLPISPVIATAGQGSPPPAPPTLTGPYELYCPHTPVGDLVLNDVVTSASISPSNLSAGEQFDVTGYQTHIPLPAGLVSAAAGLGNSSFDGLAASAVDAYGATPSQASTGSMSFDVPIPVTVPSSGLGVDFPTSATSVGPFTASGGPVTIAEDQSTMVVAALSSKAFTMSCTAYPNDDVATSGSTGTAPTGVPIRPIIATASASGSTPTTTTAPPTTVPPTSPTGPYELYCPNTPVGNIVLNDTTTSATITPSTLAQNQQFQLADLQTQFSIPQSVVEQAEGLGLTQISGHMSMFVNATGVSQFDETGPVEVVGSSPGTALTELPPTPTTTSVAVEPTSPGVPFPEPFQPYPSFFDLPFNVTLPNPVPATGVQFDATVPSGELVGSFTAAGGPIAFGINAVNLNVTEFGDNFGLFCTPFPNDTEPTGLTTTVPSGSIIEPVIATGTATITPPPPIGPGGEGPYELYCPNTPVGNVVLNEVTTTATLSPPDPSPGDQFSVTNYQTQVPLPASIAAAAAALGNPSLPGNVTATIDAAGATPASIPTGPMSFDVALPTPMPASGVTIVVPSTPSTIGPFTATSNAITIAQNAAVNLILEVSGSDLALNCTAYPDDSAPTGITEFPPDSSPVSPVIVTAGPVTTTTTTTTTPPTTPPPGQTTGAYELYCPGTPVGNIALNNVTTTASIPASLAVGQQFEATNFQTNLNLPSSIVSAAAALGNSAIEGDAVVKVDATGADPATVSSGALDINAPIPSPVPRAGLALAVPSPPGSVGPFTATGGAVTLTVDPDVSLTLTVSGSSLNLTCKPYPNNTDASGIVATAPNAEAVAPVIATSSTGTTPSTPTTVTASPTTAPAETGPTDTTVPDTGTAPTTTQAVTGPVAVTEAPTTTATAPGSTTTAKPASSTTAATATAAGSSHGDTADPTTASGPVVAASSGALAFTGVGVIAQWLAVVGGALMVLGFVLLVMVDTPRRIMFRLARHHSSWLRWPR